MSKTTFDQYYRQALQLFWQAEFAAALAIMERLSASAPKDTRLLYGRAICLFMLGRHDEAEVLCLELHNVFKDPRGQKLWAMIKQHPGAVGSAEENTAGTAAKKKPVSRLWRWRYGIGTAAILGLLLLSVLAVPLWTNWQARHRPVLDRSLSFSAVSTPDPVKEENAPTAGEEKIQGGDSLPPESPLPVADESVTAQTATPSNAEKEPVPPATPVTVGWREHLAGLELSEAPMGMVPNILALQPYRTEQQITNAQGDHVRLINLNPLVGAWYVLELSIGETQEALHLEVCPQGSGVFARPALSLYSDGISIQTAGKSRYYPLWPHPGMAVSAAPDAEALNPAPVISEALEAVLEAETPYGSLCDGAVLVRAQKAGATTQMEMATDLLRQFRAGDWLVEAVKPMLIRAPEKAGTAEKALPVTAQSSDSAAPQSGDVAEKYRNRVHKPKSLGIANSAGDGEMAYGRWYPASHHPGIFVSLMLPGLLPPEILSSYPDRVAPLGKSERGDSGEADNVVYLMAIDLDRYAFGYAVGASHPGVEWSSRITPDADTPGPDGFDSKAPLATIGSIPPWLTHGVAGVFAGGFKREHGSFKVGDLSRVNHNSHFGFVENGVVFSRLNPFLATLRITPDGRPDMLTWPEAADKEFRYVLHARQNGVPLIDGMDAEGNSIPGALVKERGKGAWSGNAAGDPLTIRAAIAIQEKNGKAFLFAAYFTGATPNAMARVFQAYHCRYAMGLDMNSLSLCYMALYIHDPAGAVSEAEYLIQQMGGANGGDYLRFLERNDSRDCFYFYPRLDTGR